LSDVLALAITWGSRSLARREPSRRFTYGLRRSTILAALTNAMLLLLVTGAIAWEAVQRFANPQPVATHVVIWVALVGIVVNSVTALLFMRGRAHDVNIRGAFLHMAADAAVSLGVVLAGAGIALTGWTWLDPAVSLLIVAVIVAGTWSLLRDSIGLALDAVPANINPELVRDYLAGLDGVAEIHDLHIWGMSTTETALTVHLVMPKGHPGDGFIAGVCRELNGRFRVSHPTLQVETGDAHHPCSLAPDNVV
jgi:cobalt-zinc-cadmium efflux system protein